MPVIIKFVEKLGQGQTFEVDRTFIRRYSERYQIEFDPAGTRPDQRDALLALNFSVGRAFPTDPFAATVSLSGECTTEDGYTWEGTVQYGPYDPRLVENPLNQPPFFEWDAIQFERPADLDVATGAPVVNSAFDYFDPPELRDDSRPVLRVQVNLPDPLNSGLFALKDTINKAPFLNGSWGPHTAKCAPLRARQEFHPLVPGTGLYWVVSLEFHFNPDTWDPQILDQGLRKLDTSTTPPTQKQISIDGALATAPVLLDGKGGVLAVNGTPKFLQYQTYPEGDFSVFGLG